MDVSCLSIPDILMITPDVHEDSRGFFMESFNHHDFESATGVKESFVQDNHSLSKQGVLRGLHYQLNPPQGKLVRVTRGEVYDVAVDVRENSPTFGHWVSANLSENNKKLLWIPPGFAHGFYVTSYEAELQYKCTTYYNPASQECIKWSDNNLNIDWPIPSGKHPAVSSRDAKGKLLTEAKAMDVKPFKMVCQHK